MEEEEEETEAEERGSSVVAGGIGNMCFIHSPSTLLYLLSPYFSSFAFSIYNITANRSHCLYNQFLSFSFLFFFFFFFYHYHLFISFSCSVNDCMCVDNLEVSRALFVNEHVVCELSIDGVRLGF